jgi:hypothetical protein
VFSIALSDASLVFSEISICTVDCIVCTFALLTWDGSGAGVGGCVYGLAPCRGGRLPRNDCCGMNFADDDCIPDASVAPISSTDPLLVEMVSGRILSTALGVGVVTPTRGVLEAVPASLRAERHACIRSLGRADPRCDESGLSSVSLSPLLHTPAPWSGMSSLREFASICRWLKALVLLVSAMRRFAPVDSISSV